VKFSGLRQQLDAGCLRHPLISQDQRDGRTLEPKPSEPDQRVVGGGAGQNLVLRSVPRFQLPDQRPKALDVVVHNEQHGLDHCLTVRRTPSPAIGGKVFLVTPSTLLRWQRELIRRR
jgi:hypothetical protein